MSALRSSLRPALGAGLSGLGSSSGGAALLPTGITSLQLMGDFTIPVTSPVANNITVPLNGRALRIVTTAAASSVDPTKLTGVITRKGYDTSGNPTTYSDAVNFSQRLRRPTNNKSQFSLDSNGSDFINGGMDLMPDRTIFKGDTLALTFASGFVTGSGAGSVTNAQITRSDARLYRRPIGRPVSPPHRVYRGNTNPFEIAAGCDSPRQKSLIACVRAFLIDSAQTKGNVGTSGAMVVSVDADGTLSGLQGLCYRPNLDTTGLIDGPATVVYQLVPWLGDTIYDSRTFGEAWPTLNYPKSFPCLIDNANNYTPVYCLVSQAKTGLTSASLLGLCMTQAGAIAANAPYASEKDAALAVKTLNNAGTAQTILSDNGLSTKTYQRPTPHNDCDGVYIIALPVAGSAANIGTASYATGSYSWSNISSQATCPFTYVPAVISTTDGAYDDNVRYTSNGVTTLTNKVPFRMCDWVGITFDYGTATGVDATVIYGTTAGAPTTQPTDAAALFHDFKNCRNVGAVATSHGSNGVTSQLGYTSWRKSLLNFETSAQGVGQVTAQFAGNIGYVGCVMNACKEIVPSLVLGSRFINTAISTQSDLSVQNNSAGLVLGNFEVHMDNPTQSPLQVGSKRPVRDVFLWSYLIRQTTAGSSPNVSISADGSTSSGENIITVCRTSAGQRVNENYCDQGYISVLTDGVTLYPSDEQYNVKTDSFLAPENPSTITTGPAKINVYPTGAMVYKGGICTDMPALASISGNGALVSATTTAAHGMNIGDTVVVAGVTTTAAYNGTFVLTVASGTSLGWAAATTGTGTITNAVITGSTKTISQAIRDVPITGQLDTITLGAGGTGYTYATVTVSGGGSPTKQAEINAILSNGVVVGFFIINYGTGYTSNPTIAINGDGSGANATAAYCVATPAMTDAAYFANPATIYGSTAFNTAFGERGFRTENWGARYHIDHSGKTARHSFNDTATNAAQNNTYGETGTSNTYFGRDGQLSAIFGGATWYTTNTASSGSDATFKDPGGTNVVVVNPTTPTEKWAAANNFGNFKPVASSPPLGKVAAGFAPVPQDSFGTAYSNTGDNSGAVHT